MESFFFEKCFLKTKVLALSLRGSRTFDGSVHPLQPTEQRSRIDQHLRRRVFARPGDGMAFYSRLNTFRLAPRIAAGVAGLILLMIVSPFVMSSASAESLKRPVWTEQAMFQFGNELFFVGQTSCAKTSEEGRQQAFRHGMQELLNYAQIRDVSGLYVDTQMVFEEADAPGCLHHTVTVWRLLRVDADRLGKLVVSNRRLASVEGSRPVSPPPRPALSIGMSRDEVFDRFGLPASITLHHDNGFTWEYRRFGFAVEFDRHMFVTRWTTAGAKAGESPDRTVIQPLASAYDTPIVDLTPRLRDLEQMGRDPVHAVSTAYNRAVFAQHSMPRYVERSPIPTDIAVSTAITMPRPDTISDKISRLWTCRGEDGSPGRDALVQTKRGVVISPACTNPWGR